MSAEGRQGAECLVLGRLVGRRRPGQTQAAAVAPHARERVGKAKDKGRQKAAQRSMMACRGGRVQVAAKARAHAHGTFCAVAQSGLAWPSRPGNLARRRYAAPFPSSNGFDPRRPTLPTRPPGGGTVAETIDIRINSTDHVLSLYCPMSTVHYQCKYCCIMAAPRLAGHSH